MYVHKHRLTELDKYSLSHTSMTLKWAKRLAFFLLVVVLASCSKFTRLQKSTDINEKYTGAVEYYNKQDYYRASVLLDEIIPLLKGGENYEKAQLYFAYCKYYLRELILSAYYFKTFYETFPRSPLAEEAYYMYCLSLVEDSPTYNLDQSNTLTAIDAIQSFVRQYPENEKREQVQGLIGQLRAKLERKAFENAKLFYRKEDYKAALIALKNFRQDYPDSEFNEEAAFLRIVNQYNYVQNSVEAKQKERLADLIEMYEYFVDNYPKSKYSKQAESYYVYASKRLNRGTEATTETSAK